MRSSQLGSAWLLLFGGLTGQAGQDCPRWTNENDGTGAVGVNGVEGMEIKSGVTWVIDLGTRLV